MADIGVGGLGYVGYAKETVEGTAVAPTIFLPARSFTMDDTDDYLTPQQIRGERDYVVAAPAPYSVTGSLEMDLIPDSIGYLLKSAFAASVSSGSYAGGGYTHTYTPGLAGPTFTFEKSAQDALLMRYTGVRVNTMEIKASFGEIVTATFGLDGVGRAKNAGAAATDTYAASSTGPFTFAGATVTIGGSASSIVKDFTFGVNNNASHIGTLRGTRAYSRVALGWREVTLSMNMDFQDTTEYDRFLAGSEFAVVLYLETSQVITGGTGKNSLTLTLPRVRYKSISMPIQAGDFLSCAVECTVLKPNSASAIVSPVLVCADSSFA